MNDDGLRWDVLFVNDLDSELVDRAAEFFNEHFPGTYWPSCDPEIFRWKLGDSNPAGRGILALAMCDMVVAGVMTATRKHLLLDGQPVSGFEVGDTFTNPVFRSAGGAATPAAGTNGPGDYLNKSVFGRLVNDVTERLLVNGAEVVYGTPNDQSRPGYLRRGQYVHHEELGISFWHRPSQTVFQRKFPGWTGRALHTCFNRIRRPISAPDQTVTLDRMSLDGNVANSVFEEIDRLWARLRRHSGLSLVQDGSYVWHRYAAHPTGSYVIHLIRRHQVLVGFVVSRSLKRVDDPGTLALVDWVIHHDEDNRLLAWAIDRVASEATGDQSPALWTDNSFLRRSTLRRMGFFRNGPISVIRALAGTAIVDESRLTADIRLGWSDNA
jgi:hypothetical protein